MSGTYMKKVRHAFTSTLMVAGAVVGYAGLAKANDLDKGTTIAWAGVEARQKNVSPYIGLNHYFTGDNFSDGFLMRLDGYYSNYEYNTTAVVGGKVNANAYAADALIGYQMATEGAILRGMVGPEWANHNLSPANTPDKNNGSDIGVKVRAEIESDYSSAFYGDLVGSYGTAKDHYYGRARAGYDFGGDIFGPEGSLEGNGQYQERRVGAFLSSYDFDPVYLSGSVGYSKMEDRSGGGSPYFTLEISTRF